MKKIFNLFSALIICIIFLGALIKISTRLMPNSSLKFLIVNYDKLMNCLILFFFYAFLYHAIFYIIKSLLEIFNHFSPFINKIMKASYLSLLTITLLLITMDPVVFGIFTGGLSIIALFFSIIFNNKDI